MGEIFTEDQRAVELRFAQATHEWSRNASENILAVLVGVYSFDGHFHIATVSIRWWAAIHDCRTIQQPRTVGYF